MSKVDKPKRVRKPKKEKKPWGKLISLTNGIDDLELIRPRYRVGRGNICAISINDEKISKFHCELSIFRDRKNKTKEGEIKTSMWIKDTSTNGVYVNSQPVGKNQKRELFHFDEITLIQPKVNGSAFPKYRFIIHDVKGSPPLSCESELLEHYKVISPIQEGIYGRIYLGVDLKNDEKVAIKQVPKNKFYNNTKEKISLSSEKILNYNEILVLQQLKHKSIIELKNVIQTDNTVYIIMEYLSSGDLFNKIKEKQFYEENDARILFKNLIESIIYLHNKNIVHRDLKPENILISNPNSDTDITICDFGIAKSIQEGEEMETRIGTIHYRAPETFTGGGKYTNSCDLWSAGVILYILLSGEMPFHEKRNLALHKQIIRGDFDFSPERFTNISKAAKNLIRRLIRIEPELRLTAKQTLEHPWVIEKPELIEYENDENGSSDSSEEFEENEPIGSEEERAFDGEEEIKENIPLYDYNRTKSVRHFYTVKQQPKEVNLTPIPLGSSNSLTFSTEENSNSSVISNSNLNQQRTASAKFRKLTFQNLRSKFRADKTAKNKNTKNTPPLSSPKLPSNQKKENKKNSTGLDGDNSLGEAFSNPQNKKPKLKNEKNLDLKGTIRNYTIVSGSEEVSMNKNGNENENENANINTTPMLFKINFHTLKRLNLSLKIFAAPRKEFFNLVENYYLNTRTKVLIAGEIEKANSELPAMIEKAWKKCTLRKSFNKICRCGRTNLFVRDHPGIELDFDVLSSIEKQLNFINQFCNMKLPLASSNQSQSKFKAEMYLNTFLKKFLIDFNVKKKKMKEKVKEKEMKIEKEMEMEIEKEKEKEIEMEMEMKMEKEKEKEKEKQIEKQIEKQQEQEMVSIKKELELHLQILFFFERMITTAAQNTGKEPNQKFLNPFRSFRKSVHKYINKLSKNYLFLENKPQDFLYIFSLLMSCPLSSNWGDKLILFPKKFQKKTLNYLMNYLEILISPLFFWKKNSQRSNYRKFIMFEEDYIIFLVHFPIDMLIEYLFNDKNSPNFKIKKNFQIIETLLNILSKGIVEYRLYPKFRLKIATLISTLSSCFIEYFSPLNDIVTENDDDDDDDNEKKNKNGEKDNVNNQQRSVEDVEKNAKQRWKYIEKITLGTFLILNQTENKYSLLGLKKFPFNKLKTSICYKLLHLIMISKSSEYLIPKKQAFKKNGKKTFKTKKGKEDKTKPKLGNESAKGMVDFQNLCKNRKEWVELIQKNPYFRTNFIENLSKYSKIELYIQLFKWIGVKQKKRRLLLITIIEEIFFISHHEEFKHDLFDSSQNLFEIFTNHNPVLISILFQLFYVHYKFAGDFLLKRFQKLNLFTWKPQIDTDLKIFYDWMFLKKKKKMFTTDQISILKLNIIKYCLEQLNFGYCKDGTDNLFLLPDLHLEIIILIAKYYMKNKSKNERNFCWNIIYKLKFWDKCGNRYINKLKINDPKVKFIFEKINIKEEEKKKEKNKNNKKFERIIDNDENDTSSSSSHHSKDDFKNYHFEKIKDEFLAFIIQSIIKIKNEQVVNYFYNILINSKENYCTCLLLINRIPQLINKEKKRKNKKKIVNYEFVCKQIINIIKPLIKNQKNILLHGQNMSKKKNKIMILEYFIDSQINNYSSFTKRKKSLKKSLIRKKNYDINEKDIIQFWLQLFLLIPNWYKDKQMIICINSIFRSLYVIDSKLEIFSFLTTVYNNLRLENSKNNNNDNVLKFFSLVESPLFIKTKLTKKNKRINLIKKVSYYYYSILLFETLFRIKDLQLLGKLIMNNIKEKITLEKLIKNSKKEFVVTNFKFLKYWLDFFLNCDSYQTMQPLITQFFIYLYSCQINSNNNKNNTYQEIERKKVKGKKNENGNVLNEKNNNEKEEEGGGGQKEEEREQQQQQNQQQEEEEEEINIYNSFGWRLFCSIESKYFKTKNKIYERFIFLKNKDIELNNLSPGISLESYYTLLSILIEKSNKNNFIDHKNLKYFTDIDTNTHNKKQIPKLLKKIQKTNIFNDLTFNLLEYIYQNKNQNQNQNENENPKKKKKKKKKAKILI
ncbi:ovarian-specific serine/threonine-protein kinase lok-related [Anaeramoeba flamelloides]|uniref:Ovarian-specific serine/threonine-protein kinase lok-related n=1 Tax=Anaeramoeba flamelloides TaxID=1746091 RepID=A0AAV8A835_9EUKA|nr:ovarian-specific serine/threonine-protein kinase lok-related [Anaeramoeba flamelloides]